jgi:copper chaperone
MSSRLLDADERVTATAQPATPYLGTTSGSRSAGHAVTITIVSTRSIAVTGMTCGHCATTVRAEISKIPGVSNVDVDVAAGTVRITGEPLPSDTTLRAAVEEAGYEFAG